MITYEINNPKPPTVIERVRAGTAARRAVPDMHAHSEAQGFMDKVEYAKWIGGVQAKFTIGSKWTLAALNYIPGAIPVPVYTVVDVTEIHWSAPLDDVFHEPRCVFVTSERLVTIPVAYSPKMLRPLNEEELRLVNLRNQKPSERFAGPGEEIKIIGNEWCLVSLSTGEVLKKYTRT